MWFSARKDTHDSQCLAVITGYMAYIATLPVLVFVVIIGDHLIQSFVGGWMAARLGHSHPMILAMTIGVLSLLGGIAAMVMIAGPAWLVIELPLYLAVAWGAGRLEENRRACAG
jgi:hypothetical protein